MIRVAGRILSIQLSCKAGVWLLPGKFINNAPRGSFARFCRLPDTFLAQQFHSSICVADIQTIKVPAFPESIAEGDLSWKKAAGDTVLTDEIIAEIETDKTAIPVLSPCTGVITELLVQDGEKVVYAQQIGRVDERAVEAKAPEPEKPKPVEPTAKAAAAPAPSAPAPPTPAALAPSVPSKPLPASAVSKAPLLFGSGSRSEQRVKMTRIRLRTAERLKEAQNTCAMLTTFNEIDMSNLIDLRNKFKEAFAKKHGVKLGIMSTFSQAAAYALRDQPIVNAFIDGKEIVYRNYIDLSIAVASPKGLVVPVLRNVDKMNFGDIERGIFELGEKAKSGMLALEDMDGGTFTISNGGIFGSLFSTPIVNPPQSAILGLHGTFERPVARNGQVVIRPMMYVALSYDHRLIDGREAVLFLRKIKSFVEDPRVFFLDI
uniref:Dihydrolipoyllysine-residue succinyltransferase component of 2-oxoglutarate dehydrogenase complex, mitochondrial n=1 Tax=Schistocephalus solidus TaxID=70667 RepID=A0A0X3NUB8_SCHSO